MKFSEMFFGWLNSKKVMKMHNSFLNEPFPCLHYFESSQKGLEVAKVDQIADRHNDGRMITRVYTLLFPKVADVLSNGAGIHPKIIICFKNCPIFYLLEFE